MGLRAALVVVVIAGCSLEPVDLTGKACPCAAGWRCNRDNVCEPSMPRDGALPGFDGGPDFDGGAPFDGGPDFDAGLRFDGGPDFDAGTPPADSGAPRDGGVDATMPPLDSGMLSPTSCDALDGRSDVLFCDGFENASLSPWTLRPSTGTVSRETTIVRRGTGALRARTTSMTSGGRADAASPSWTPVTSGNLYYRAWYYVPSGFAASNFAIMVSSENVSPYEGFHMHFRTGDFLNLYNDATGFTAYASTAVPRDRWFCLQMRIVVSGSSGEYHVSVDGTEVITGTGIDTLPTLGYSAIGVGITYTTSTQALATVYVDEVAAARNPISCD